MPYKDPEVKKKYDKERRKTYDREHVNKLWRLAWAKRQRIKKAQST